ncbi:MAG TPA: small multi-drug export protein [Methanobacterium sp.]|nr:small multi-drug export protein [Methanobacterium sp.]
MDVIYGTILVFGASILELWAGIPIGIAFQLNPFLTGAAAALGAILAAFIVSFLGEGIREKVIKWRYKNKDLKKGRFYKIWNKYGIIGLGLISPLLFGAPLGAALGIAFGAEKKALVIWMSIGIVLWSIILTTVGYLGLMTFQSSFNMTI